MAADDTDFQLAALSNMLHYVIQSLADQGAIDQGQFIGRMKQFIKGDRDEDTAKIMLDWIEVHAHYAPWTPNEPTEDET
jgi:hypothetical protein